jgi:geranylgeranyl reductase family protein
LTGALRGIRQGRSLAATFDVIVAGAGPGGLSAARALAAEGHSVLVLEEHASIGQPVHCTGLLGLQAFDEFDLPRETIRTIARSARFRGADGRSISVDAQGVAAAVVDRAAFDRVLAARARDAGADVRCGHRVHGIAVDAAGVTVTVARSDGEEHTFYGRACILACGAQYRFNRQLGLGIPRAHLQTAQVETTFAPVDAVEIDLDRNFAPGGFAWVVPFAHDGMPAARIGLMASSSAAMRFSRYAKALSARFALDGIPDAARCPRLKVLPLGPVRRTYGDRVVAVGDAAGLAKPTTGGGIYYSLISGGLAAEVLSEQLRADRLDASALRNYEVRWRARLGPELRAGLAFRTLAARFDNRAVDALIELAAVDGILPLLRRTADFNWHRESALALLRNAGFRRIVLNTLWT